MISDHVNHDFSTEKTLICDQYLIHLSNHVYQEIKDKSIGLADSLHTGLGFAGYQTEGFAHNGHNGTDGLLVVPESLSENLHDLAGKTRGYDETVDFIKLGVGSFFDACGNTSQKQGGSGIGVF